MKNKFYLFGNIFILVFVTMIIGCAGFGEFIQQAGSAGVEAVTKTISDTVASPSPSAWSLPTLGLSLAMNLLLVWLRRRDSKVKKALVKGISKVENVVNSEQWSAIKKVLKEEQEKEDVRESVRKLLDKLNLN